MFNLITIILILLFPQKSNEKKINAELNYKINIFISKLSNEELNCYSLYNDFGKEKKETILCANVFDKEKIFLNENKIIYNYLKAKIIKQNKNYNLEECNFELRFFITICLIEKILYHNKYLEIEKILTKIHEREYFK